MQIRVWCIYRAYKPWTGLVRYVGPTRCGQELGGNINPMWTGAV